MLKKERLIDELRDVLAELRNSVTVYSLGSYGSDSVAHEEFDLVALLDDPTVVAEDLVIQALAEWVGSLSLPSRLTVCNAFVPRSYDVALTVHVAIYRREELLGRRPRIIRELRRLSPLDGPCSWVGELWQVDWPLRDLITERWGLVDSLATLLKGCWNVELMSISEEQNLVRRKHLLSMDDPVVRVEYLWYSCSKLTLNAFPYVLDDEVHLYRECKSRMDSIQGIVGDARRGEIGSLHRKDALKAWLDWLDAFQELLRCMLLDSDRRRKAS